MQRTTFAKSLLLLGLLACAPLLQTSTRAADSSKDLTVTAIKDAPSFAKRALVIGIAHYEQVRPLTVPPNDARNFAKTLQTKFGFPKDAITLMTDDAETPESLHPTHTHMISAINRLLSGVTDQSEVIVFFSGHGTRDNDQDWLIPVDGDPDAIADTCISYSKLRERLDTKRPHRALLVIDACRNLRAGKDITSSGFGAISKVSAGPQIAELLSCEATEVSQEGLPEDFNESVFTHFLLQGLQGDDPEALAPGTKLVTFDSLKVYVRGKVSQYVTAKLHAEQNPDGRATLGSMVLARGVGIALPTEKIVVNSVDTVAHLQITTNPPGAKILVDGVAQTSSDYSVDLGIEKTKVVEVDVTSEGYRAKVQRVTLVRGTDVQLIVSLDRQPSHPGAIEPIAGGASKSKVNPLDGAEMILIPSGEFKMGSEDFDSEKPIHKVILDAYYIYKYPVTVTMYKKFCDATGKSMPVPPAWGWEDGSNPIVNVSWDDAVAYCAWAGASLPTEAQWEKAARGTDHRRYPWGNDWNPDNCRHSTNASGDMKSPCAVDEIDSGASFYGVMDMAGNVWQWCADWYDPDYYFRSPTKSPTGPRTGSNRVMRGGSWFNYNVGYFGSAYRASALPSKEDPTMGFRCVVSASN